MELSLNPGRVACERIATNRDVILDIAPVSVPHVPLLPTQGLPASWWNHLHNQHHAKPNCFRKDPDLNMHPLLFSLGKTLSVEVWKSRFNDRKLECDICIYNI